LHAEVARLKSELASKGQERDTPYKGSKPADVQELQEKLQRLRKEQQEADAARDKAWKQLKVRAALSARGACMSGGTAMYLFLQAA
jgi:uncharacterized small protein (DUF1192 family)